MFHVGKMLGHNCTMDPRCMKLYDVHLRTEHHAMLLAGAGLSAMGV